MIVPVLVNYRNNSDTVECLGSLFTPQNGADLVIVVDNSEDPRILEGLKQACRAFGSACRVIAAPMNQGFAAGCNLGIHAALEAGATYVLLLNNDTLAPPDFGKQLLSASQRFPGEVITGRVRHHPSGENAHAIGEFTAVLKIDHWLDNTRLEKEQCVAFASGCLLAIPSETIRRLGGLDERFFMYGEDVEYCLRLKRAGVPIHYCPSIEIRHKEGASCKAVNFQGMFYDLRNAVWIAWNGGTWLSRLVLPFYLLSVFWRHRKHPEKISLVAKAVSMGLRGKLGKTESVFTPRS